MNIKNLVLSGGSSKGYTYIGLLRALEEKKIIGDVKNFLGTSVGAIFASLFSMGFSYEELITFCSRKFELEDVGLDYLLEDYGLCSGNEIIDFFTEVIGKRYNKDITFKELHRKVGNTLYICVSNLNEHKIEYLCHKTTPDMKITDAIRFAITLPYIFTAKSHNNNIFMDAVLVSNISFYNFKPKDTLGILLSCQDKCKRKEINNLEEFTLNILNCIRKNHTDVPKEFKILKIKCNNVNVLDFSLTNEKRLELFSEGYYQTLNFLKKNK